MLEPGTNWGYVIAAYGAALAILGALVLSSLIESRRARHALEALERRQAGGRR